MRSTHEFIKETRTGPLYFDYTCAYSACVNHLAPLPRENFQAQRLFRAPDFEDCPVLNAPLLLQNMESVEGSLRHSSSEVSLRVVDQILSYIQDHLTDSLSAQTISAQFGYHAYHINRLMRKATGMTLHQYVLNQRLTHAKELLIGTDLSIDAIAESSGWEYACNFSSNFRQYVGMPPSQFRAKNKNYI